MRRSISPVHCIVNFNLYWDTLFYCLLPGQIHCISVQNRCGFPFFRGCHDGVAGFAMYFHRYLYSCPSECSAVPRLQGNLTSAQIRSFILDFNDPFDREKGAAFLYSEELVITWLATLSIFRIITILALQKVPDFLGYKAILHQLKFLPSYWTLMILLFVSLTRYVKLAISAKSINSWMILMGLALNYILRTLFVGLSIGRLSGVSHLL